MGEVSSIRRIIICLDLSAMDNRLIQYLNALLKTVKVNKLYFIHIRKAIDSVNIGLKEYQIEKKEFESNNELIKAKIDDFIVNQLNNAAEIDWESIVIEGSPSIELLHWVNINKVDLLIIGRKDIKRGSGITAGRLLRKSECSVLFVPEKEISSFKKVLIPVDFSASSDYTLKEAYQLANQLYTEKITCQHIYFTAPTLNLRLNRTPSQFRAIVESNLNASFKDLFKRNSIPEENIKISLIEDIDNRPASSILKYAKKQGIELIMMGPKGQSQHKTNHIGSVTESLLTYNYTIPLLVIKQPSQKK